MENNCEVILAIINNGFSEVAMDAAKQFGARGGTIIHGRGTASKEAEKFFNISIQPEKEIVMILIPTSIKENVLRGLYTAIGSHTQAQGIVFSLPVSETVGLNLISSKENEKSNSN